MATSTPLPRAAARGVEVRNWHGEDGGRNDEKEEEPRQQKECHRTTLTPITRGKITTVIRGRRPTMEFDDEDNHHKTTTGTETETDNHNHTTNTAAHDEGDDKHGTRTERTGDGL